MPHFSILIPSRLEGPSPVTLIRHNSPWPLVIRLVHPQSGTQRTLRIPELGAQSQAEEERLKILS